MHYPFRYAKSLSLDLNGRDGLLINLPPPPILPHFVRVWGTDIVSYRQACSSKRILIDFRILYLFGLQDHTRSLHFKITKEKESDFKNKTNNIKYFSTFISWITKMQRFILFHVPAIYEELGLLLHYWYVFFFYLKLVDAIRKLIW